MNKKLLAATAIIALGLGAFALYALVSTPADTDNQAVRNGASGQASPTEPSPDAPDVPTAGAGDLRELLQLDADIECAYTHEDADGGQSIAGTLFKSGEDLRVDALLDDAEFGQYVSSLIRTPDMVYLWSDIDGQTYGVRASRTADGSAVDKLNAPLRLDDSIDYECEEWDAVDRSVFLPPGEVLFRDFGATQQSGMEYGTIYEEGAAPLPVTSPADQE